MIITKAKHSNIVSMKDADIKVLKNKNRSMQNSLFDNLEEINELKEEIKLLNTEINMKNDTILHRTQELTEVRNSLVEARKELLADTKEIRELKEQIDYLKEASAEDSDFLQIIINDRTRLEKEIEYISEIKRQIQECINTGIKAKWITGTITKQEARKLLDKKNLDLLVDLYSSANML